MKSSELDRITLRDWVYLAGGCSERLVDRGALYSFEYLQSLIERHYFRWEMPRRGKFQVNVPNSSDSYMLCLG